MSLSMFVATGASVRKRIFLLLLGMLPKIREKIISGTTNISILTALRREKRFDNNSSNNKILAKQNLAHFPP
jgi:hypothetical protein